METHSRTSIDLASLARIATLAVAHVEGLQPTGEPVAGVVEVLDDGSLLVSLRVLAHWGSPLPAAAGRARAQVVRVVTEMTGLHVARVDVEVVDLVEPGEDRQT